MIISRPRMLTRADLDLEELDATALEEELVEPPEDSYSSQGQSSHQQASQPQAQQPQQYQQGGQQQAPAQGSSQQPFQGGGGGGGYGQQGGFQQQQAPQNPEDRLKSDAQDEGLVHVSCLYSLYPIPLPCGIAETAGGLGTSEHCEVGIWQARRSQKEIKYSYVPLAPALCPLSWHIASRKPLLIIPNLPPYLVSTRTSTPSSTSTSTYIDPCTHCDFNQTDLVR